jgi:hypothetical protein
MPQVEQVRLLEEGRERRFSDFRDDESQVGDQVITCFNRKWWRKCCRILHVEYLNLSHEKDDITKVYLQPVAKALMGSTSLRCLHLSRKSLECKYVASLFYALQTNQTLRVLDSKSNVIDNMGAAMLASALSRVQGLRELDLLRMKYGRPKRHGNPTGPSRFQSHVGGFAGGRRILSCATNDIPLGLWPKDLERSFNHRDNNKRHGEYIKLPKDVSYQPDTLYHML